MQPSMSLHIIRYPAEYPTECPYRVNTVLRRTVTSAEYKSNQRSFPDVLANAQLLHTPFTDLLAPYMPNSDDEDDSLRDLVY